jgi:hypothetical protein
MAAPAWYTGPPAGPGIEPGYEKHPLVFYLGTHQPHWLWNQAADFPLFVSHRTLRRYTTLRRSTHGWALDSGGFSEVSQFGEWRTSPREYVAAVARYDTEIGSLHWAAPQEVVFTHPCTTRRSTCQSCPVFPGQLDRSRSCIASGEQASWP